MFSLQLTVALILIFSVLILLPLIQSDVSVANPLVDRDSFLTKQVALQLFQQAAQQSTTNITLALLTYNRSYILYPNFLSAEAIGWLYEVGGDSVKAQEWYTLALSIDHQQLASRVAQSTFYVRKGDFNSAKTLIHQILADEEHFADAHYSIGSLYYKLGDYHLAAKHFHNALAINPCHDAALLNLATIHQAYGSVDDALVAYEALTLLFRRFQATDISNSKESPRFTGQSTYSKALLNLSVAYLQLGRMREAMATTTEAISYLKLAGEVYCKSSVTDDLCNTSKEYIMTAYVNQWQIKVRTANWTNWEMITNELLSTTLSNAANHIGNGVRGPLLPFDTLLLPVSAQEKLKIVSFYSSDMYDGHKLRKYVDHQRKNVETLRIGFISFDFNDHPTAHLVEGIFHTVQQLREKGARRGLSWPHKTELIVYSYGKDDGSSYRNRLSTLADKFVDVADHSYEAMAEIIYQDKVDILLDMQLHTLGNRLEVLAMSPAPLQVNYLVYPGSAGTSFHDSIVVDKIVAPPERHRDYSESLLMLPPSYQISFFDRHVAEFPIEKQNSDIAELRRVNGLPTDADSFIFCNFNKADKLDLVSFRVWMSMLRIIPKSVLWLLEPMTDRYRTSELIGNQTSLVIHHLQHVALGEGIDPKRILFAKRTSKANHIFRHRAADLFLDCFIYGAHSTATDALRGGLPVLTFKGDSFTNRVVASLYESIDSELKESRLDRQQKLHSFGEFLVVDSLRDFENVAVYLARKRIVLSAIKQELLYVATNKIGIFNTSRGVYEFMRSMQALSEFSPAAPHATLHQQFNKVPHIILTKSSKSF